MVDFGGGAAFVIEVEGLAPLHAHLRGLWQPWLTRQDDRPLRPHVTIQNKVDRGTALRTQALLRDEPVREGLATGFALWHYRGGPWETAADFTFRARSP